MEGAYEKRSNCSPSEYGRSLRVARRERGLTQEALATRLGVTKSYMSKVEAGTTMPSQRFYEQVQDELGGARLPYGRDTASLPLVPRPEFVKEPDNSPYQLGLDLSDHADWIQNLLPTQTLVSPGPPPVFHWDIPQTIKELSYLTHNFFRYYGKFPPTIPRRLLRDYRPTGGTWVLDNFSGSGTTLVEAKCEELPSIGVDVSPLATLAASVKTSHLDLLRLQRAYESFEKELVHQPPLVEENLLPPKRELEKWYRPEIVDQLSRLKGSLLTLPASPERDFLIVTFFSIIRRVSRAYDGEVRPHINTDKKPKDAIVSFKKKYAEMLSRTIAFQREAPPHVPAVTLSGDNRMLMDLVDWSNHPIGLVISHPPYLNCFDYFPVYKLEYLWARGFDGQEGLNTEYAELRKRETRCWPATDERVFDNYFKGLEQAYGQVANITDRGTRCCVVLGDCSIKGKVVPVLDRFSDLMDSLGFSLERTLIRSTHYGTGKYAYAHRADYHGDAAQKRDGILIFKRR